MRQVECRFEADVLSAVMQSRWPERVDAELKAHVKTCEICSDVAAVACAIECAREESVTQGALPDSGLVWWKAQMRARREAIETVSRPITAVQVAAFAVTLVLLGACIGATSSWFQAGLKWGWGQISAVNFATLIAGHGWIFAAMIAMVFVVPVAVYLAVGKD